jgi:hypothetical protein
MSSDMRSVINELKNTIASLEAMVTTVAGEVETVVKKRGRPSKKAIAAAAAAAAGGGAAVEKPKRQVPPGMKLWHEFNARIDALMKANEMNFKRVAEAKQFASLLKKEKATTLWTDDEILTARTRWADEHRPLCVVCHTDVKQNPTEHNVCGLSFAKDFEKSEKGTFTQGIAEWAKQSGVGDLLEDEPVTAEKKKPGRPKMTEEEKAAAKAAREAKKEGAEIVTTRESLGPPPGSRKVAWVDVDGSE